MNPVIRDLALEMGFPQYAVRKWKLRQAVPHKHRLPLLREAERQGKFLRESDFDFRPAKAKRRKARGAQQVAA